LPTIDVNLLAYLGEDQNLIAYRKRLNSLTGSVLATILLQQTIFWWEKQGGDFYKYKAPCGAKLYRPGDSWIEELGFSRDEFNSARAKIASKVPNLTAQKNQEIKLPETYVWYWTTIGRVTWYRVNVQLLSKHLISLYVKPDSKLRKKDFVEVGKVG